MRNISGIQASLAAVLLATGMSANGNVLFDIDGTDGAFVPTPTDGFDVFPGNALAVGSVPTMIGAVFTLEYQAEISVITQNSGATIVPIPVGATGPFELTVVVTLQEEVVNLASTDADPFFETVGFEHSTGTFSLYYDNTPDADDISPGANSGTGYSDGVLIASGTVRPGNSTFTIDESLPLVPLDSFNANELPGIQTLDGGIGSARIDAVFTVLDLNVDFFPNLDLGSIDLSTTLETPFNNNNPSLLVNGVAPNYGVDGINGLDFEGQIEDFHFEADGNAAFSVPASGSLSLLVLGLGLLGFSRRK